MEKIRLNREQAEAIESTRRFNSDQFIVFSCLKEGESFKTIPNIDPDTLIRALYIGYEVEETPEEKVRELYNHWNDWMGRDGHYSSQTIASTIVDVLDALNIKIEGVNDNE